MTAYSPPKLCLSAAALFILSLFAATPTAAQTVLIDWSDATSVSNPAGDGKYWNSLGAGNGGDVATTALVDVNNASSGFSVAVDNTINGSNNGSGFGGSGINGPAGADPFDEAGAIADGIFANNNTAGTSVITFTGLGNAVTYDFTAIGGRASNGNNGVIEVITGTGSGSGTYSLLNTGALLNFSVTSSPAGEIVFDFSEGLNDTSGTTNSTWNALSFSPAVSDTDSPTLASSDIVDDQSGGPVEVGTRVTYTVTFSEDINGSTVSSADFDNAGTSEISFGTILEISAGVFTLEVTPTTIGDLQLSVPTTATIEDLAGNPLDSDPAILDSTTITVTADSTPPTLTSSDIVDDRNGLQVPLDSTVTYTLTFSEDIDAGTVDSDDFANAGTSTFTIGTITESFPGIFTVEVTPTTIGTLQLRIAADAAITDASGLSLAASPAIIDDTSITVVERMPNIVLFLVDDMGVHDTSVPFLLDGADQPTSYNFNNFYQTPNMETLASQGLRFTTAYAQTVCSPTRVGLLTGRTSARHGVSDWVGANDPGSPTNWRVDGMTASEATLPKELQSAGYRTIHVGKAHLAKGSVTVESLGFDVNIGGTEWGEPESYTGNYGQGGTRAVPDLDEYHNTGTFLTKALSLEANKEIETAVNVGEPFFLHMSFFALHTPFTTNPDATGDYSSAVSGNHTKYATMVEGVDIAIGDIRQKLIDLGVAEDTLIIFIGDNGSDSPATNQDGLPSGSFSDWPMRGKKASKWEGGARVPFIATWAVPDATNPLQQALPIPANAIETDIVTTWDLPATILDLAGLSAPLSFGEDSHSLLPYLAGTSGTHRPQEIVVHYPHEHRSDFFSWIRQGDLKLIYNFQNNSHELYDLATDPTESTNLAATQPDTTMALTRRLSQLLDAEWGPAGILLPTISSSAPVGNVVSIPDTAGVDLDEDGIDDRLEDTNLNGLVDPGEMDPDSPDASSDDSLVAHYKFEETSGSTLVDSSVNGQDGTVVGSGDLNVSGIVGSAYEPGGSGSYGLVSGGVSAFGIGGNNARSISFWFKTPNFGGTNDQYRLIGIGDGSAAAFNIVAESGTNAGGVNRIGLRYGNGNVYFEADNSGSAFATDTWYHVAVVYDGTTLDLESIGTSSDSTGLIVYVNGIEVDTAAGNLNNPTQALATELSDFALGANADGTDLIGSYPGLLDEVRIYGAALSAAEVASLVSEPGTLPQIQSFSAAQVSVEAGTTVTLSWEADNYDSLTIEPGSIDAAALSTGGSGSTDVTVNETTTYTLAATKDATTVNQTIEVQVPVEDLQSLNKVGRSLWTEWYRPVDSPVFSISDGNNHDPIIFYEPSGSTYKYYLIIAHETSNAFLWGANSFSWDSADWTLIEGNYQIDPQYEFDDAVKVGGTYYLYEEGKVFTYTGDLVNSSGNWTQAGTYPKGPANAPTCDDIGVFYEDGIFHIFGENGVYPDGFDGLRLSHYTSTTGVGNWTLVDTHAVDPNPDGGTTYGVGDPTIAKIGNVYYLFCDRESIGSPYRVTVWSSTDINQPFEYLGVALAPRSDETNDWDNYRIQDADIQYIPELKRFIMVCNMMDTDGSNPDSVPPFLPNNTTRVVGTFYSKATDGGFDTFMQGFEGLTGNDALYTADPDYDGSANGEEYAAGSLPDDPKSSPVYSLTFATDGNIEYPAITFDRIIVDPNTSRTGQVSNTGNLQSEAFKFANGTEVETRTSEVGGFYEEVTYRSDTQVNASEAQFIRVETNITSEP